MERLLRNVMELGASRITRLMIVGTLTLGSVASAQDAFMNMFNNASQAALKSVGGSITAPAPAASPTAPKPAVNAKAYEFKTSPQVSAQVRQRVIDTLVQAAKKNGKLTPAAEKQLRDSIGKMDVVKVYTPVLEGRGHKMNSFATAISLWAITNLGMISGNLDSTPQQEQAVVKQFQQHLSSNPAVQKMTDADKQFNAEALMWMTAFQTNDYLEAKKGTPGYDLNAVLNQARTLLKGFNLDPDALEITDQGLTSKAGQ